MKKKKGFTLVELLVVIAILAILAAVSVVGYLSFTEKAKLSNDQTTIKMINDNLMADSIQNKPKTAGEALTKLENLGFTKEKLVAYSNDHHYVYDLNNNRFLLLDENDQIIYPENANTLRDDLWGLYTGNPNDNVNLDNYVVFDPIVDGNSFSNFVENLTVINIDLNNKYFYLRNYTNENVKINLYHGYFVEGDSHNSSINSSDVEEKAEVIDCSNGKDLNDKTYYKDVIFDFTIAGSSGGALSVAAGENTKFENCMFLCRTDEVGKSGVTIAEEMIGTSTNSNTKLTLTNCVVANSLWFQTSISRIDIQNSSFTNCVGGINLQRPTIEANIVNNIFDLTSVDSSNRPINTPLMLSPENLTTENGEYNQEFYKDGYHINFSNNTINETYSLVRIHSVGYTNEKNLATIIPNQITIVGNKIGKLKGNIVEGFYKNVESGPEYVTPSDEALKIFEEIKKNIK